MVMREGPHVPLQVASALEQFTEWARRRFGVRLERIALFGSFARGDGLLPDSDVDVLVVVEGLAEGERFDTVSRAVAIGCEADLRLSPLVLSAERYSLLMRQERLLATEIERDGVAL